MAAITAIEAGPTVAGAFTAALTTLTSSDTITFNPGRKQLLVVRNPTGGTLNLNIDGADGTTVNVPGIGSVNVASGLTIAIPTLEVRAVVLSTISEYLKGVVTLTGASGCIVQMFNL